MFKDLFSHIRTISHKANLPESLVKLMPSDKPQVSGYLPPAAYSIPPTVYDQLIAFKAERGLESIEMAVTVILSEYFGLLQVPVVSATDSTTTRLKTLEAKCTSLSGTVAELQTAIATLQRGSSQSVNYKDSPDDQHKALPLQGIYTTAESISSPSVDQSKSLELVAVSGLQADQSESERLPVLETLTASQSANDLPKEHSEALNLTAAITLSSGHKDIEPESTVSTQKQQNLEQQGGETFSTPMTQANLAKRLGVATSTISRMQSKSNFLQWSQQRDPDSIAWFKSPDTKLFYPQTKNQETHELSSLKADVIKTPLQRLQE